MECLHENLHYVSEEATDKKGRSNATICLDCDEMIAAMDITNG